MGHINFQWLKPLTICTSNGFDWFLAKIECTISIFNELNLLTVCTSNGFDRFLTKIECTIDPFSTILAISIVHIKRFWLIPSQNWLHHRFIFNWLERKQCAPYLIWTDWKLKTLHHGWNLKSIPPIKFDCYTRFGNFMIDHIQRFWT